MRIAVCLLTLSLILLPLSASAAVTRLASSKNWHSFRYEEKGNDVCYMLQRPAKSDFKRAKGDTLKRGDTVLMITLRPAEHVGPIVSFEAGYSFKAGSEAKVTIDKESHGLFTDKSGAWARTSSIDKAITRGLRKGKSLTIAGQSSKGSRSLDRFDLSGSEKAYQTIAKACGISAQ